MEERWFGLLTTKTNWPLKGTSVSLPFCNGPVFKTKTWGCKQVHSSKTKHLLELHYPWIWGIFPHTFKFHYVQHFVLELCRSLSKQFHASHHSFDDTALNADLVSWHKKLSLYLSSPVFSSTLTFATSLTWTSQSTGRSWSLLVLSYPRTSLASLVLSNLEGMCGCFLLFELEQLLLNSGDGLQTSPSLEAE